MQVRCLTTGRVRGKRRTGPLRYLPGGWSDETLPVHAFAVDHPDGSASSTPARRRGARGGYHPRWHPYLRLARFELEPEDEVASQLDPLTVRWVVLSHLHTDHVGASRRSRMRTPSPESNGSARPACLAACAATSPALAGRADPRLVDFGDRPPGPSPPLTTSPETAACLVPPGHTPGHAGLLVDGETLLAGDASWPGDELRVLGARSGLRPG